MHTYVPMRIIQYTSLLLTWFWFQGTYKVHVDLGRATWFVKIRVMAYLPTIYKQCPQARSPPLYCPILIVPFTNCINPMWLEWRHDDTIPSSHLQHNCDTKHTQFVLVLYLSFDILKQTTTCDELWDNASLAWYVSRIGLLDELLEACIICFARCVQIGPVNIQTKPRWFACS